MRVLLAIDDSKFSEAATLSLVEIAKPQETLVHIIHVIDALSNQLPEMTAHYPGIEHERDAQLKPAEVLVARMAALLRSLKVFGSQLPSHWGTSNRRSSTLQKRGQLT